MASIETMIKWMQARHGKVKYSMASRYGPNSYDCSSAVYNALVAGGFFPAGTMGNTDSLFGHLDKYGWVKTTRANAKRGDIFVWGKRNSASGKYGHTGIFLGNANIIHCNSSNNGITMNRYDTMINGAGNPTTIIYTNPDASDTTSTPEEQEILTNVGELELLGIANGKIIAQGWHFSSDKDLEYIAFINAETDEELGRMKADPVQRNDLKEEYPNAQGIETAGFDVSFKVENNTAVYIKGLRTNTVNTDELIFNKIIIFEQAFDPEVETFAATHEGFFVEVLDGDKVLARFDKILNELNWANELMGIPSTEIVLPIEFREYFQSRAEVKIYINRKVFHGVTTGVDEDKQDETISVSLSHVIREWEFRQVSTNLAAKNRTVNDIYSTFDFRYPNWNIEYLQDSAARIIDYVYSRQGKLEALTKTCELTNDLFWRVGFHAGQTLDIGVFGDKKPYMLSTQPSGTRNIRMISEPIVRQEYDDVINMATVYGEKSDSGMSSMSLREVYEEEGAQDPNFPVVILKKGINNERGYDYIEFTKLAPNNEIEYTVIDSESIALEAGTAIEGTFSFNDLAPFAVAGEEITDEDRAKAAKTAYDAAVKKLKQSRRRYIVELETERLPHDINIGDRIRLLYDNSLLILGECSNYQKKILSMDDWYYITSIEYNFDQSGGETNIVTLEKELRTERESDEQ